MTERLALAAAAALWCAACGDDDDDTSVEDAGPEDAGPWESGVLTCANDVMSDYALREYTYADPFNRNDLGPYWHTDDPAAWTLPNQQKLLVTGAGDGPGPLALVGDGQQGTEIVGWFAIDREEGWAGGPSVVCRADGPPLTQGYGARVLADRLEVFEQAGAEAAAAQATAIFPSSLPEVATVRVVLGCTSDRVTAFVYQVDENGDVGEELGCTTWQHGDAPRSGAFALTHGGGATGFDDIRMVLDPR